MNRGSSDGDVLGSFVESPPDLRALLETLDWHARDTLRPVLIGDQADRDAISELCAWPQTFADR
jgi:hypothetical protein